MKPEWIRELFRKHWLRLSLLYSVPLLAGFSTSPLPFAVALAAWAASSAFLGYGVLAVVVLSHQQAHMKEARRMGHAVRLKGSLWNPVSWFREGLAMDFPPPATPREFVRRVWDEPILSNAGPWLHERLLRLEQSMRWDFNAATTLVGVWTFLLVPTAPLFRWSGIFLALAALTLWARLWVHGDLQRLASEEVWLGPIGSASHHAYEEAHRWSLLRLSGALSEILLDRAGLRPGDPILELGAGSCVLWQFLPPGMQFGWIQCDAQFHPLRYAQSHNRGQRWLQADPGQLPFGDDSLRAVVGAHFLDSLSPESMEAALSEVGRVLKPGGVLVHLADFEEHPGETLVRTLNQLSPAEAIVSFDPGLKRLRYGPVSVERVRVLRETLPRVAQQSEAPFADRAALLLEAISQGGFSQGLEEPRRAFLSLLSRACGRHGLSVLQATRARDHSTGLVYLVAIKD